MILTGSEIVKRIGKGDIVIDPFERKRLNPNSYNLRLHNELMIYNYIQDLDMKLDNPLEKLTIPETTGFLLRPGRLYLGRTVEYTKTRNLVPILHGRSSWGRLGINIHICAGLGDVGYCGNWTLEISVVQPVRIYPFTECCQILYSEVLGDIVRYEGKYQDARVVEGSKMYKELK